MFELLKEKSLEKTVGFAYQLSRILLERDFREASEIGPWLIGLDADEKSEVKEFLSEIEKRENLTIANLSESRVQELVDELAKLVKDQELHEVRLNNHTGKDLLGELHSRHSQLTSSLETEADRLCNEGDLVGSAELYLKILGFVALPQNDSNQVRLNLKCGRVFHELGQYNKALDFLVNAYKGTDEIAEKIEPLGLIMLLHLDAKQQRRGQESLEKLIRFTNWAHNEDIAKGQGFHFIGRFHSRLGNNEEAFRFYSRAYEVFENHSFDFGIASVSNNLGIQYFKQKDYDSALTCFDRALNIFKRLDIKKDEMAVQANIETLLQARQAQIEP
ncbi:MAG: tetratricopeptide repeat protein [Actinomycetota bacterium]|nr:tetratricopeptide repeat protein [Actinomycetota bacterium]